MDWILNTLGILGMLILSARQAQIPPELVLAMIEVESGGEAHAVRICPTYAYTVPQARRPGNCNLDTELYMQRTSWGLMQIMGATARGIGFEGWLPELCNPVLNVQVGVGHLGNLMSRYGKKFGLAGVVAAYNAGAPRTRADGRFVNQAYVDKVMKGMEKYKSIVEEKEEAAIAEVHSPTQVVTDMIDASDAVLTDGESDEKSEEKPPESEIDLDKMSRAQLLDLAKLNGITIENPKAKLDEIRNAISAAGTDEPQE